MIILPGCLVRRGKNAGQAAMADTTNDVWVVTFIVTGNFENLEKKQDKDLSTIISRNFPAHISAEWPSNISPNPSKVKQFQKAILEYI